MWEEHVDSENEFDEHDDVFYLKAYTGAIDFSRGGENAEQENPLEQNTECATLTNGIEEGEIETQEQEEDKEGDAELTSSAKKRFKERVTS